MRYLYGKNDRKGIERKLVATFDGQQQLLSYVRWATLSRQPDGTHKYEQGSALVGYTGHEHSPTPLTDEDAEAVLHNPTPSML